MNYSFTLFTSKADCDTAIAITRKRKNELEYRKITLEHKKQASVESAVEIETALQALNAEIATLETLIAGLPEGETKKTTSAKKQRLSSKSLPLQNAKKAMEFLVSWIPKLTSVV
jgi:peptidoglycan hydrolase CwlO-like protein